MHRGSFDAFTANATFAQRQTPAGARAVDPVAGKIQSSAPVALLQANELFGNCPGVEHTASDAEDRGVSSEGLPAAEFAARALIGEIEARRKGSGICRFRGDRRAFQKF